jgi:DNA-binding response OmpR family regulator
MDVNLPKIDGVEATKRIKAQRSSTVVIGLLVHQENQVQHVFKEGGASGYVTKDAAADSLYGAIIAATGKESAVSAKEGTAVGLTCSPEVFHVFRLPAVVDRQGRRLIVSRPAPFSRPEGCRPPGQNRV